MLHVRPELVRTEKFPAAETRNFPNPILVRDCRRHWPGTVEGDPATASAEKGEILARMVADYLAELVKKIEAFEPH